MDYVIAHAEELVGQEIEIEGYISYAFSTFVDDEQFFGLVSSNENVINKRVVFSNENGEISKPDMSEYIQNMKAFNEQFTNNTSINAYFNGVDVYSDTFELGKQIVFRGVLNEVQTEDKQKCGYELLDCDVVQ